MTKTNRFLALGMVAALTGFSSCGGDSPSAPVAVATPTPSPSPTPTPTPSPTALSCGLAAMPECSEKGGGGCCKEERSYALGEQVELAIRDVQMLRPDIFNGDEILHEEDEDIVVQQVARRLEQRFGLCAKAQSPVDDEVAVKNSNSFSEQYDIILSNHRVNVHGYTVTCRPARF